MAYPGIWTLSSRCWDVIKLWEERNEKIRDAHKGWSRGGVRGEEHGGRQTMKSGI